MLVKVHTNHVLLFCFSQYYWIGLTDHGAGNEGNLQWLDGSTWTGWTQWGSGEPDDKQGTLNNADCVAIKGGENTWWDMKCDQDRNFICQSPGPAACSLATTAAPTCNNGYYGNGATCTACPANKYSASWSGSIATASDCTPCNPNSHTNGQTGKTACTHCDNGYYGNGVTCTACPANKFSSIWSGAIASAADCTPCNPNSHTNGQTAQTSCTHCDNGFYGNGAICTACPANKFSSTWSGAIATASDCTPCNPNSHTNGQTGKTVCTHCYNGYYGNGVTCTACPEDTYSTVWSGSITSASHCTDCPVGYSTNGLTGQTSLSSCTGMNEQTCSLQLSDSVY